MRASEAKDTKPTSDKEGLGVPSVRFLRSPSTIFTSLRLQTPHGDLTQERDDTQTRQGTNAPYKQASLVGLHLYKNLTVRLSTYFILFLLLPFLRHSIYRVTTLIKRDNVHFLPNGHQNRLMRSRFHDFRQMQDDKFVKIKNKFQKKILHNNVEVKRDRRAC